MNQEGKRLEMKTNLYRCTTGDVYGGQVLGKRCSMKFVVVWVSDLQSKYAVSAMKFVQ